MFLTCFNMATLPVPYISLLKHNHPFYFRADQVHPSLTYRHYRYFFIIFFGIYLAVEKSMDMKIAIPSETGITRWSGEAL
jgi:hypothetical protein